VDHRLGTLLWVGRRLERGRDLLGDPLAGCCETRLEQRVLVGEVIQECLLADPDGVRDRVERRAGILLGAELPDGVLDKRGLASHPARP